jgi:hypothetical protein
MTHPPEIDIRQIVEDFLRTATPEQMMEALHESDPNGIFASVHFPVLDAQPKKSVFLFRPETFGAIVPCVDHLYNWGIYRSPGQRRCDPRLGELELAA